MRSPVSFKPLWIVAILGATIVSYAPRASALSFDLTTCDMSTGCLAPGTSYGTVNVTQVSSGVVDVTLTLAPGEVFANTGAGDALLFDLQGISSITIPTIPPITPGFTATTTSGSIHADGTGTWQYGVSCTGCGPGTSSSLSGPLNFDVAAGGITPASFTKNSNSLYFAADIGVPSSSCGASGYCTGDVGTPTAVPLPAAAWLLLSGLAGVGAMARRKLAA